jgi:hypothetical protein
LAVEYCELCAKEVWSDSGKKDSAIKKGKVQQSYNLANRIKRLLQFANIGAARMRKIIRDQRYHKRSPCGTPDLAGCKQKLVVFPVQSCITYK